MLEFESYDIQKLREHLGNIERELSMLKKLVESSAETKEHANEERIQELRRKLISNGLDEEIVMLVGTIPLYNEDYKDEIRNVLYERHKRKHEESAC